MSVPTVGRMWWSACIAVVGALALGGCGGGNDEDGGGGSGSAASTSMSVAIGGEPKSMDPILIDDGQRDYITWSVYEGLTARNADGEIVPGLATEWNQEGDSWIFTLREGVKFHNGDPVTPADVVASYERMLDPDNASELLGLIVLPEYKVEAEGDTAVRITPGAGDPTVPGRAALLAIAPASLASSDAKGMTDTMIGTGPYKFVEWNRGQDLTIEANPDYWGDPPKIKKITLKFLPSDNARLAALKSGEVAIAAQMSADLSRAAPQIVAGPISEVHHMQLNTTKGKVFADKRLRLAANLAIDRQSLIEDVWQGYATPAEGQSVGQYVFGSSDAVTDYPYDPDEARKILEDAGAVGTQVHIWAPSGRYTADRQVAEAEGAMLEEVGFKVKLEFPEYSKWSEVLTSADNDSAVPDIAPYNTSNQLFDASQTLHSIFVCEGVVATYCNKSVDEMVTKADHELDTDARQELYDQIWTTIKDDAAVVQVADVQAIHFAAKNLKWPPRKDPFLPFAAMEFTAGD